MKIAVEKINEIEVKLEENAAASLWDMDSFDVKFVDQIHLDCGFLRAGGEIIVNVIAATHRLITCSRCLEETVQDVSHAFTLSYEANHLGDYLEIDKEIREELLLNFPMKVLCKTDCKGICPRCGVNLNNQRCKCQVKPKLTE
ncbi:MAG: DUF177 domain-containing protein [Candidatus Omnitrophota bacterium]|nr:MAG: DUF177 domain-containing protein [Candidatus Omnitrophota bacterium]